MTFSKNIFWSLNFSLTLCQIFYARMSFLWLVQNLTFLLRSCIHRKKFQESHVSHPWCDRIFQGVSPKCKFSSDRYHVKMFENSMYKTGIASCACADVSAFKYSGLKMFEWNTWSEYQNLAKKFQTFLKI